MGGSSRVVDEPLALPGSSIGAGDNESDAVSSILPGELGMNSIYGVVGGVSQCPTDTIRSWMGSRADRGGEKSRSSRRHSRRWEEQQMSCKSSIEVSRKIAVLSEVIVTTPTPSEAFSRLLG